MFKKFLYEGEPLEFDFRENIKNYKFKLFILIKIFFIKLFRILYKNFQRSLLKPNIIDDAYSITDEEAFPIIYQLIKSEGLSLGTSSGINIAGAIKLGKELGRGKTIITILCDLADRYKSKIFNKKILKDKNISIPDWL